MSQNPSVSKSVKAYSIYLLIIAGLGGLLYGVDVGIIAGALPFIKDTSGYTDSQLSQVVAAVLFGSVLSSLFAGILADIFGRKAIIILSAVLFSLSIPVITLSDGLHMLMGGRILQGASGGLLGVVVPLYLAECLAADKRGKGTGMFQFLLTIGLLFAAVISLWTGHHVESVELTVGVTPEEVLETKDHAWRLIFWLCLIPGILMTLGAFFLSESPRWLFRKGRREDAMNALRRGNSEERAQEIMREMEHIEKEEAAAREARKEQKTTRESLLQRKYIVPFVLAVLICAFNQATGINSVLNYSVTIFQQGGLDGSLGNWGDVSIKTINCIMTVVAMALVDRKGRKFLLKLGTSGIIVGLIGVACMFWNVEKDRVNITEVVTQYENHDAKTLKIQMKDADFMNKLGLSGEVDDKQIILTFEQNREIKPEVGASWWQNFYTNTKGTKQIVANFRDVVKKVPGGGEENVPSYLEIKPLEPSEFATNDSFKVVKAELGQRPDGTMGTLIGLFFVIFIAFYAVGPGVCVWLALSELMPTRIRSNGMAIALLINQGVSTTIAGVFLPWVSSWGYAGVFFTLAGFTVFYFITAAFFLPETKGKTLEEIEEHFSGKGKKAEA